MSVLFLDVCVHSSPFISNVTYHISSNGSSAILVTCMNGDIIRRECDKESFYQDICLPGTTFGNSSILRAPEKNIIEISLN